MMWRHGLFNCQDLNVNSNADDAQVANLIRMGGHRSILDNSVQFTDFAAENRDLELGDTLARLRQDRLAAFAFGGVATVLLSIPFLNVLVLPVAVCGGAVLWRSLEAKSSVDRL